MAGSKGDVELVIRAKNEASRNLDAVNKSLRALADQQTLAGNTAGTAQGKFAQLGQQLQALKTNAANLKSLSSVASVLDAATGALGRLRAGAADAGTSLENLQQRQAKLATDSNAAAAASKATADAVKSQDTAYKAAQKSVRDLTSESGKLASAEKATQASIVTAGETIAKLNTRLAESVDKQKAAAAAVDGTDKATKRQIASLDSANTAMARRQAALDAAVAKEAALRDSLEQTRAAMTRNKAAQDVANAALAVQAKVLTDARAANTASAAALAAVGAAQRAVATDITNANKAHQASVAALQAAEAEYAKLKAVADAARAAVGANAPVLDGAGAAAGRAAVQVAVLAARLTALSAGGGAKSGALGIDPAAIRNADGSVRELGVTIRLAANEATKASVTVDQLKAAVVGLGQTKNQLTGLSDTMTKQQAAVAGAEAAWRSAREEQLRLAAALKASAAPSDALAAGLGRAQAAAKLAWEAFVAERTAADAMTASLAAAGVGSGTFASAQAALGERIASVANQIKSGNSSLAALPGVLANAGGAADGAEPKVSKLRTAMIGLLGAVNSLASKTNPLGGLSSSIVSLVGASVGLYGIKDQLDKILDAGLALDGNKQRFTSAFGSIEAGNKELDYAREVATNLKLPINDLAKGYSRLALAAQGTSLEGEGARKIFEGFAQSTRVNQTSVADLEGVFTALTQIISKGTVQMEELRQQLGDRLPGALKLLATGIGVSDKELNNLVSKGMLTRDVLVNMAQAISGRVAPALLKALTSPAAQIQNFENQVTKLRETIAGSGFLDAFASSLEKVGTQLGKPEAIQGAKELGKALGDMITWLAQAPEHFDAIVSSIKALGIAWAALQITSMITGVANFVIAIGTLTAALFTMDVALSPVLVGLGALAAVIATVAGAFVAWKLVEWVYENVPAFAEGVLKIQQVAMDAWNGILTEWEIVSTNLKASFGLVTAYIKDLWLGTIRDILNFAPELSRKLGLGDLLDKYNAEADAAGKDLKDQQSKLEDDITEIKRKNLERQEANAKKFQDSIYDYHKARLADEMTDEQKAAAAAIQDRANNRNSPDGGGSNTGASTVGTKQVTGATGYVPDTSKADAAAAKKAAAARLALEKSVANEMYTIRAKLESKSADDLQEKIDAVPAKYAALYAKLDALGKGKDSEDRKSLDALVAQEQELLRIADFQKRAAAQQKEDDEAYKIRLAEQKAVMEDVNTLYTTRKDIQLQMQQAAEVGDDETYDELRTKLIDVNAQYATAIQSALGFWAVSDSPQADNMIAKLEKMNTALQKVHDQSVLTSFAVGKTLGTSLKGATDGFVDNLAAGKGVIESLKLAFVDFARSFLINIAKMILQQLLLNALQAGLSGAFGGGASSAVAGSIGPGATGIGGVAHNGATAGLTTQSRTNLNPAVFNNAVKYHGGGMAGVTGLKNDEVATVLQKGETIRTQAQEAALSANQASSSGQGDQMPVNLKIVNAIDSASVLNEGLSTVPGQQVFMNFLRANKGKIQGILN